MITQIVATTTRIDDATVQSAPTISLGQATCPVRTEDRVCPDPIWRSNPAAPVTRPPESQSGCLERLSRAGKQGVAAGTTGVAVHLVIGISPCLCPTDVMVNPWFGRCDHPGRFLSFHAALQCGHSMRAERPPVLNEALSACDPPRRGLRTQWPKRISCLLAAERHVLEATIVLFNGQALAACAPCFDHHPPSLAI